MNLLKKMEIQDSDIFRKEQLLLGCEKEKGLLKVKLKHMEEQIGRLEEDLCEKTKQGEETEKLSNQLIQQIDSELTENVNRKMQLRQLEQERAELLGKVKNLEGRVNELQALHRGKGFDGNQEERFHQQLQSEKKKMSDLLNKYKSLKSQYNYLLMKNRPWSSPGVEDRPEQNLVTTPSPGNKNTGTSTVNYGAEVKDEVDVHDPVENEKDDSLSRSAVNYGAKVKAEVDVDDPGCNEKDASLPKSASSISGDFVTPKSLKSKRSSPVSGTKRPASSWRDARSHQSRCGPDPHDDFLDTPLENIRGNHAQKAKSGNLPNREREGVNHDAPDNDETEDMTIDPQPMKAPTPATSDCSRKSFKYVSAVRKKAECETLKGVECKQCKKFYDAVLPDNNGNTDSSGTKTNFRCEHLDGASRHRYKEN